MLGPFGAFPGEPHRRVNLSQGYSRVPCLSRILALVRMETRHSECNRLLKEGCPAVPDWESTP
jgi:hypothetical protein